MFYPSATATAVAATISDTLAPRLRSQTGFENPCNIGPIACAPASSWANLYAILPALRSGKINTLACPWPNDFFAAIAGFSAASAWIGPKKPVSWAAVSGSGKGAHMEDAPTSNAHLPYSVQTTGGVHTCHDRATHVKLVLSAAGPSQRRCTRARRYTKAKRQYPVPQTEYSTAL